MLKQVFAALIIAELLLGILIFKFNIVSVSGTNSGANQEKIHVGRNLVFVGDNWLTTTTNDSEFDIVCAMLSLVFNTVWPDPSWDICFRFDFNNDGIIDIFDAIILANHAHSLYQL